MRIRRTAAVAVLGVVAVLVGALGPAAGAATDTTYTNPVFAGDAPDPFVLRVGTTYYGYTTNGGGDNVPVLRSTDLAHWTPVGDALPQLPSWVGPGRNWSPAVLAVPGGFVLYYTALNAAAGHQCIGVATATSPIGPFVDTNGGPFMCQLDRAGSIDPSPFRDAAGNPWLTWKSEPHFVGKPALIWTQRLTADGTRLVGNGVPVLDATQAWERGVVEAPSMLPAFGRYFLFYSGGTWDSADYATSYAVCDTPSGPCRKPLDGAVMSRSAAAGGPGGAEVFADASGAWWMAYHAWTMPAVGYPGGSRTLRLERIAFAGGVPVVSGPTAGPTTTRRAERVAGADRYATAAAFSASTFAPGVPVAYVATGRTFPDALAAGAAGARRGGPVLLAEDRLGAATTAELRRLRPQRVVVLGGPNAVPDAVIADLTALGIGVSRVAGADRYATAAALSQATYGAGEPGVLVATGMTYADALTAGAARTPLLLVGSTLPGDTHAELDRLGGTVTVLGGEAAVGARLFATLDLR